METNNVVKFPQPEEAVISYELSKDSDNLSAIYISKNGSGLRFGIDGRLETMSLSELKLTTDELKRVMVSWLAIVAPELINFDDEDEELDD